MGSLYLLIPCLIIIPACQAQQQDKINYQSYGRCDGCEAVFEYGDQQLTSVDTLPDFEKHEPKIKLTGTIYKPDGKTPASGVVLFIYHTNPEGKYPKKGSEQGLDRKQGYIRGWVKTDSNGRYTFLTFMPGVYSSNEAHIHTALLEPNGRYYFIDDFNFENDPYFKKAAKRKLRGGSGVIKLVEEDNLLVGNRDIFLGLNIEGYE